MVREAHGDGRVQRVTIRRGTQDVSLDCDRVACGYGLLPNVTLAQALGCAVNEAGEIVVDGEQRTSVDHVFAAGECTGIGGAELAGAEGEIAGLAASGGAARACRSERAVCTARALAPFRPARGSRLRIAGGRPHAACRRHADVSM